MSIAIVSASAGTPVRADNDNGTKATDRSDDSIDFANILFGLPATGTNSAVGSRDRDPTATRGDGPAARKVDSTTADPALLAASGFVPALPGIAAPVAASSASSPTNATEIDGSSTAFATATVTTTAGGLAEYRLPIGNDRQTPAAGSATIDDEAANLAVAHLAARSLAGVARGEGEQIATVLPLPHPSAPPPPAAVAAREAPRDFGVSLHDPAWSSEFGQKLLWFAGNDRQVAQLSLHPPQLGSIDIILDVKKESTDAHFVSPNADVRGSIEAAVPRLREMFALAGIDLGQVSVGSESFQQQTGEQPGRPRQPRVAADNAILGSESASALPGRTRVARRGQGLIDIFA